MYRTRHFAVAFFIGLLAVLTRTFNFRHGELPSYSEIIATLDALLPIGDYLHTRDIHLCPLAYYLLLKPITTFGSALWLMRLPSLLLGSVTPVLVYVVLRNYAGGLSALFAGLFTALAPLHIFYSQQAEPLVIAGLASFVAFALFLKLKEEHKLKLWLAYDATLLVLMHAHREAAFVAFAFLVLHLARTWWLRATAPRLRWHRLPPVAVVLLHHFWIVVLALPWLAIMPTKASWEEAKPLWSDLLLVPVQTFFLGGAVTLSWAWIAAFAIFYLSLLPAFLHTIRKPGGIAKSALLLTLIGVLLPFLWSLSGRTRFHALTTPLLVLPVAFAFVGNVLAHSRPLVKFGGSLLVFVGMLTGIIEEARKPTNPPYAKVAAAIENDAPQGAVVVTLPDYAVRMSTYFLGHKCQTVSAAEFFEKWAEIPKEQFIYFANYQFPTKEAHPYTLRGALTEFSRSRILFRNCLNLAAASQELNIANLRLWYDDPETLNIVDQPSSTTLFLFHPYDQAFRGPEFIRDNPSFEFEPNGRRCVWLARENATIPLKVALMPGRYLLRLHASPDFECPDTDQYFDRSIEVLVRIGEEQVQRRLDGEGVVELSFDAEVEMKSLTVILGVSKVDEITCPVAEKIALKIYSISIETVSTSSDSF
ncbi:MAG: glycosyltransferase family 39 protein [Candidatus Sumerlaeaceae bacterium]|nr:glycosyltransferase family 39 protein [Candidatus Sumerlaeaceae bacterium]